MRQEKKWKLWGALFTIWLGLMAWRILTETEPQRVPLTYRSGKVLSGKTAVEHGGSQALIRTQTKAHDISFREPKNIFAPLISAQEGNRAQRLGAAKKAPVSSIPVPAREGPTPEEVAAQQARLQQELALQQAQQKLVQYRFLGYVTQNGESKAFLGKGNEIYIVTNGDTLEGHIKVKAIEPFAVTLLDTANKIEASVPLTRETGTS
ncbi:MAG: hypothetical protein C4294_02720 [Nitrospiraceae bacterium]